MKIIFVIDIMTYGGAPKMIVSVADAVSKFGHDVSVYSYAGETSPIVIPNNIKFIKGTTFSKGRAVRHLFKINEIRKTIISEKPDLVVAFMPYPSILSIIATSGIRCKVLACERGDPSIYKGFISHFGHKILQRADGAVFQTEEARSFYSGCFYERSVVIPNAVTMKKSELLSYKERKNEIAFVGRFEVKQKRQDIMISAFEIIAKKHPEMQLVFYGDGADMSQIQEQALKSAFADNIRFAGKVTNINEYLQKSKLFVLASDYEGIPNALIEAMCVGLPCVATDCTPGGARLLIEDGVNGFLVPRRDVKAVADACINILDNPEMGYNFGRLAQRVCERFAPEKIYTMWNEYLTKIAVEGRKY